MASHIARHSYASHLLKGGVHVFTIQVLLSHNASITTEMYTHVAATTFKSIKNPLA